MSVKKIAELASGAWLGANQMMEPQVLAVARREAKDHLDKLEEKFASSHDSSHKF